MQKRGRDTQTSRVVFQLRLFATRLRLDSSLLSGSHRVGAMFNDSKQAQSGPKSNP
jgi:hypothetical protein